MRDGRYCEVLSVACWPFSLAAVDPMHAGLSCPTSDDGALRLATALRSR